MKKHGMTVTWMFLAAMIAVISGCGMLPPPITASSPKANVARAIERALAQRDTVYLLPTQVEYEKRGLWLPREDTVVNRRIGEEADRQLLNLMREYWQKEVVLVQDPVQQSQIMGDAEQVYFQLWVDGFSRTPVRNVLAGLKTFLLMGPTLGYNMNSSINTSSDMIFMMRKGGPKAKTLFKQKDEDDLDPADPSDLSWQVHRMVNPGWRG
jgi:hypothetical protein